MGRRLEWCLQKARGRWLVVCVCYLSGITSWSLGLISCRGGCQAMQDRNQTFLTSIISFLSVLDLNAFERQNKAEGLGMVNEDGTGETFFWVPLSPGHHLPQDPVCPTGFP